MPGLRLPGAVLAVAGGAIIGGAGITLVLRWWGR